MEIEENENIRELEEAMEKVGSENNEEEDDNSEKTDIIEVILNDEEIDQLIEDLQKIKQSKDYFSFDLDSENELMVFHEDHFEEEEQDE